MRSEPRGQFKVRQVPGGPLEVGPFASRPRGAALWSAAARRRFPWRRLAGSVEVAVSFELFVLRLRNSSLSG